MTRGAVRVSAPRGISFARSRRVRRFWRSMDAALRCTAGQPGKVDLRVMRRVG